MPTKQTVEPPTPVTGTGEQPRVSIAKRLLSSTTAWIVVWLVAAQVAVDTLKPLRYVQLPAVLFEEQDPLDGKAKALTSGSATYNTLLLGSSLTAALSTADGHNPRKTGMVADWKTQTESKVMDTALTNVCRSPVHTINMGIDGCMLCEDIALLKQSLLSGHHPKLAILMIAPRDFIANSHKHAEHVNKYFSDRKPLFASLSWLKDPTASLELVAERLSLYKSRGNYKQIAESTVCQLLHRAPTLYWAQQGFAVWQNFSGPKLLVGKAKAEYNKEKVTKQLSDYYKHEYLPVNYPMMDYEMREYKAILQTLKDNGIVTVVVNMPRSAGNEALLPDDFRARYYAQVEAVARQSGMPFFNFQGDPQFTDNDYLDGVHLTTAGSKKFVATLTAAMDKDAQLQQQLKTISW